MRVFADLHTHSTASDGTSTPQELVDLARGAGVGLLALTDHDTVAGLDAAAEAARAAGIAFVDGVEISAEGAPGRCHLLGLGFDPGDAALRETLETISQARRTRNARMVERLNALGVPLTLEAVAAHAPPGANVGRPHFAAALVACGAVRDRDAAFRRYLADGAPAYVPRVSITPGEAIRRVHDAGGMCFLAHPMLVRLASHETLEGRVKALAALGLDGIEVYYSGHTPSQEEKLRRLAERLGLEASGGSDFHGANKPGLRVGAVRDGRGLEAARVSERLRARARPQERAAGAGLGDGRGDGAGSGISRSSSRRADSASG